MTLTIIILLLLIVAVGLLTLRVHQFNRPRVIRWQIGHQMFTFEFPFRWLRFESHLYLKDVLAMLGLFLLGLIIFIAVCVFLFLFIGIILPIILVVGLVAFILFLIFVI